MTDELISKTDVIKIIKSVLSPASSLVNVARARRQMLNEINELESKPEIVRCKDCKHHWTHKCMDSMPIERCDLEQTFYDAEVDFCSLAERRKVTT